MAGEGPDNSAEIARLIAARAETPARDADAVSDAAWQWRQDGWGATQPLEVRLPEARAVSGED